LSIGLSRNRPEAERMLFVLGTSLLVLMLIIAALSDSFAYGHSAEFDSTLVFISLYFGAGLIFIGALWLIKFVRINLIGFGCVILLGLLMRLTLINSEPIYEDDFYRYLWDGAVMAHGIDPYKYPPADFLNHVPDTEPASTERRILTALAADSDSVIHRVNFPYIKTQYPLIAQAAFVISYYLEPWSLTSWRLVCLACEALTLFLLVGLLDSLGRDRLWALLYWWNPLAIIEIVNRAHMEALLLPPLVAVLYFAARQQNTASAAALAGAVGVKFWPVLLAPLLFRYFYRLGTSWTKPALVFLLVCLLLLAPQIPHGLEPNSGLVTYSQTWLSNSFAFPLITTAFDSIGQIDADLSARWFVALIVSSLALWLAVNVYPQIEDLSWRMLVVVGALFLLSPTQYPWYALWLVPFLATGRPVVWPLIALVLTLPLYFLRFPLMVQDRDEVFEHWIVTIEFLPIWLALAAMAIKHHLSTEDHFNAR